MDIAEFVPLPSLAQQIGMDRSNTRKYVIRQGFSFQRIRTPESRGQMTLAVTAADCESIIALRQQQGFGSNATMPIGADDGWFYIIQLVPDLDQRRVKLGFTASLDSRLQAHRTAAPTAEIVHSWPCRKAWELTAIASLSRTGCQSLGNEAFTCDDILSLIARGDAFFALMPRVLL